MSKPDHNTVLPPFTCTHTKKVSELLHQLNCTLVLSTYQAGKVILVNAQYPDRINMLPRNFPKAMGIAVEGNKMAVATKDEVIKLVDSPQLAINYPNQPGKYKNMYVPRATYYTGNVDIHDLHFGGDGLWAVNTSFSCLCLIDDNFSFVPKWKPPFISQLVSEDRCHLNGLAMMNNKPKYVTALGTGDTFQSWRTKIKNGGILMDVDTNEIVLENLAMPHSPRMYNNELYLLLSATGEVVKVDLGNRTYHVIKKLEGFVRGMAIYNDYMFIGISKLRPGSSGLSELSLIEKTGEAGIQILHLPTEEIMGELVFKNSVDELYDLQIIPNTSSVGLLNITNDIFKYSLSIPGQTFWGKPEN
jgi:uncharacterized protein (TIGR03032 family)